jgi:hypothetical protein
MMAARVSSLAALFFSGLAAIAQAGGPLGVCNSAPLKYSGTGTVNLNYDGGGALGSRTKAQADAIVSAAAAKWTDVGTATLTIGRGADLPVDVRSSNYTTYYGKYSDGLNPVIYDTDGSIIDAMLGSGQKSFILGFAGSASYGSPNCRYIEGDAVINGSISVSDATMVNVIAHELGHLIGLDHTQLDSTQGLASSNYPLMYPIAYRTLSTLHDDDIASVSALYPGALSGTYGTLTGYFRQADGVTPVRGANIWARDVSNSSRVFSIVSDYLKQGNGYFSLLLPPGTYTLHAEAIASDFESGSSVGPYSESYPSSVSFQAPMYVNGSPIPGVTLGGSTPTRFTITAGCAANATFRLDGGGSVGGNCGGTTTAPAGHLVNLSTRGPVTGTSNPMIGGFVIGGSVSKTVMVLAKGPSLAQYGIANALSNPTLTLVRASDNATIATNDNWGSAANAAQIQSSGVAPGNALESAVLMTLAPGAYTAVVSGAGGVSGIGLVEVYEIDRPDAPLINVSTRGQVSTGADVMIGGFVIQGSAPQTLVVRARGPSLTQYGITGALANPTLTLVRASDNATIASNDNWGTAANLAQLQATGLAPGNALEAAVLVTLQPGAYTTIVSGAGGTTGIGIVEVYAVP